MMNSKVSIVQCANYDPALVFESVKKSVDLIGGISNFIKPKSKVLVKPNLLMAKEPEFGITTHPEVVGSVIKLLKEIGCVVYLGDGPSVWGAQAENIDEVYEKTGMKRVAREEAVELVKFEKKRWRQEKFPLTTWLDECDYLVSIPKFKTHELTVLTGAIKNLFGLVWSTYKTELHMKYSGIEDFARIIVDIYADVRPALTVIDGILALEGDGPATSGVVRKCSLLFAGSDCVALDSILAKIIGLKPLDIPTTKEAAGRGLGEADIGKISIFGEKIEGVIGRPFRLPMSKPIYRKLPQPIMKIVRKLIHFHPKVNYNKCILCGSCIKACPSKVMQFKAGRVTINYSKCISCFCCQEVCPKAAISVKKSFFAKLAGL